MARLVVFAASATLSCAAAGPEGIGPRRQGSLLVDVYPNPIIARQVSSRTWDFPFEVSLRETGGADVEIDGIRVEVKLKGLPIFAQTFDETELTRRGYPPTVPAGGNAQYRFSPRREVPSELIFSHVAATVVISGVDSLGNRTEAATTVTVSPK